MVKSKLCLDNEKMGDPDRAHRYFAKNPSFALIKKKFAWIKILHRLPTPSVPEKGLSFYWWEDFWSKKKIFGKKILVKKYFLPKNI